MSGYGRGRWSMSQHQIMQILSSNKGVKFSARELAVKTHVRPTNIAKKLTQLVNYELIKYDIILIGTHMIKCYYVA
jgi:DNA-binding MarR family transcriptional regulator